MTRAKYIIIDNGLCDTDRLSRNANA